MFQVADIGKNLAIATIILLVAGSLSAGTAAAQWSPTTRCLTDFVKNRNNTHAIAQPEAEELAADVAKSIGLSFRITIVPCEHAPKVLAQRQAKSEDGIQAGDYVFYDPDWVREVIGDDRVQAIALFGHELGHFVNQHFDARNGLPLQQKETEADHFAGCAVARLNGSWASLENFLSRIRKETDQIYPSRLASLGAARRGFVECGPKIEPNGPRKLPEPPITRAGVDPTREGVARTAITPDTTAALKQFRLLPKSKMSVNGRSPRIGGSVQSAGGIGECAQLCLKSAGCAGFWFTTDVPRGNCSLHSTGMTIDQGTFPPSYTAGLLR